MKEIRSIVGGLVIVGGVVALSAFIHAQVASPAVKSATTTVIADTNIDWSSASDLAVMLRAVEMTTPLPPSAAPRAGTFYSAQHAEGTRGAWPPLPANIHGVPIWSLGDGIYLLDDLNFDYTALAQPQIKMEKMDLQPSGSSGGGNSPSPMDQTDPDYGTNLWIANFALSAGNGFGIVSNTEADVLYEIQSKTNLLQTNWDSEAFIYGSELTNWTAMSVAQNGRPNLFLRIRSWIDSTGTGIPDWWWLQYFGQTTNVDANASAAGDGYSNLQKFQMGLNPFYYYNPNPPGGFFGAVVQSTNAIIVWNPSPGPVASYLVQRGIYDPNTGNYSYTGFVLNSNATFFKDVGVVTNDNAQNNVYNLEALYPGGTVTATDTWYVANSAPPYGPPVASNLWVYADWTGTNLLISWTPAQGSVTNYIIERGIFNPTNYDYGYFPIAVVGTNVNSFELFGELTNQNYLTNVYAVVAAYPHGIVSLPSVSTINAGPANGPAAPTAFYGYMDSTGTNAWLTWNLSTNATGYIIYRGIWNYYVNFPGEYGYIEVGKVGAGTNSFERIGANDAAGDHSYDVYTVVAVYSGGVLSQAATPWRVSSGTAPPGTLYAYVDSSGTNVILGWSAASPEAAGYIISRSGDWGNSYTQIATVNSNTVFYEDTNGVNSSGYGLDSIVYEIQATYPRGGVSVPVTATVSNTPPAPTGLSANVDSTGTNIVLSWQPALGPVSGYTIERGTYNPNTGTYSYSQIATVSASTTSYTNVGAFSGGNANNDVYEVIADESNGQVSPPDSSFLSSAPSPPAGNLNITAQMVRNENGRWQLMFSAIPPNVQAVAFYWYMYDYDYYDDLFDPGEPYRSETDILVSSIINNIFVFPDFMMTNWFPDNAYGKVAMVQPIGTNGQYGVLVQAGFQPYDSPVFVDARQHMKQNLIFELRSATVSQRNNPLVENSVWNNPFFQGIDISPADTNYVESSIFHYSVMFKGYGGYMYPPYLKMDNVWPIVANYELHQNLYDPNYSGPPDFNWQPQSGYYNYNFAFQGVLATIPAPPVLGISDPYWTPAFKNYLGITIDWSNLGEVAAYTNGNNLYLQSGAKNLFGLPFATAMVNEGGWDYNEYPEQFYNPITLTPGGSPVAITNSDSFFNVNVFFSQTADPNLLLTGYYFSPVITPGTALIGEPALVEPYPLPALPGFSNTNQTGVMIASVDTPTVIGGWAKFAIQNGSPNKFAYLGQYYLTNAFVVTNGIVTTNTTGVVSPYGDFFPTQPGTVAMITMPDIDTGQQGTGVVRVISLNVDANHDGTMDFTYSGPDFVSASKPFRFWVNDNQDSGDYGGNGVPGQPSPISDGFNYSGWFVPQEVFTVHGRRDLVDFFPVYLNIGSLFQSNALSAGISVTDTNWQFILSQADGILRFVYTDLTPTNYMNYLRDANESGSLAYAMTTTITPGGVTVSNSFLSGIATHNEGIILVEAAASTTQPLVLTIYHGTNQIAQTSLYLSISEVEQMFRYKNLLIGAATNQAGLLPGRLTDSSVPNEPDTIDKNVVFVHGYNVNPYQARGWFADIYKRLYWSGSHAKFYGVNWYGNDSQGVYVKDVTANYQTNVVHAFQTAPLLANFIATLTNGPTVVMAHSLGNMVALSAMSDYGAPMSQFFMLDAAVPMEAIDPNATANTNMIHPQWFPYANRLYASDWYQLFPTNDTRNILSWNDRLADFGNTEVYNFYSSGEEVLRTYPGAPPSNLILLFGAQLVQWIHGQSGFYSWAWQEKDKGRMSGNAILSSNHGGWKFNSAYSSLTVAQADALPNSQLITNAFFDMSVDTAMFTNSTSGSNYAQTNRNRILSDAIPALTLPIGANYDTNLDIEFGGTRNFDMQSSYENGWPAGRGAAQWPIGTTAPGEWHHSDVRAVAYTFTYKLFNQMVTVGNLK